MFLLSFYLSVYLSKCPSMGSADGGAVRGDELQDLRGQAFSCAPDHVRAFRPPMCLLPIYLFSVCLCASCLSICLSTYRSVHLWVALKAELLEMNLLIFQGKLSVALPITSVPSVYLCAFCLYRCCLSTFLSICPWTFHMPMFMSSYLPSVYLSVYLSTYPPIEMSIYL